MAKKKKKGNKKPLYAHPEDRVYGASRGSRIIDQIPGLLKRSLEAGLAGVEGMIKFVQKNFPDSQHKSSTLLRLGRDRHEYQEKLSRLTDES